MKIAASFACPQGALIRVILAAFFLIGSCDGGLGQAVVITNAGIPVVTVCEALNDLSLYNGKSIVLIGRFSFTDEGR